MWRGEYCAPSCPNTTRARLSKEKGTQQKAKQPQTVITRFTVVICPYTSKKYAVISSPNNNAKVDKYLFTVQKATAHAVHTR